MKTTLLKMQMFLVASLVVLGCNDAKKETTDYEPKVDIGAQIEKGKNLVNAMGCHDCHSPKVMTDRGPMFDPERLLSGHNANEVLPSYDSETAKSYVLFNMNGTAAIGPWGTSYAGNLTPDDTGIGTWSETQFLKAVKQGKYKGLDGSRPLLPPMPWQAYAHMPDEDLKAIFAYLKSIKPVENIVPAAKIAGM